MPYKVGDKLAKTIRDQELRPHKVRPLNRGETHRIVEWSIPIKRPRDVSSSLDLAYMMAIDPTLPVVLLLRSEVLW